MISAVRIIHRITFLCSDYSIKGKRVIAFEGERTVQDIIQFAEKANRYIVYPNM